MNMTKTGYEVLLLGFNKSYKHKNIITELNCKYVQSVKYTVFNWIHLIFFFFPLVLMQNCQNKECPPCLILSQEDNLSFRSSICQVFSLYKFESFTRMLFSHSHVHMDCGEWSTKPNVNP